MVTFIKWTKHASYRNNWRRKCLKIIHSEKNRAIEETDNNSSYSGLVICEVNHNCQTRDFIAGNGANTASGASSISGDQTNVEYELGFSVSVGKRKRADKPNQLSTRCQKNGSSKCCSTVKGGFGNKASVSGLSVTGDQNNQINNHLINSRATDNCPSQGSQ